MTNPWKDGPDPDSVISYGDAIDQIIDIPQIEAEKTMRKLAQKEGVSAGTSSGGAVWASIKIAEENPGAVIACIICDRGDRYLSTGLFSVVDPE